MSQSRRVRLVVLIVVALFLLGLGASGGAGSDASAEAITSTTSTLTAMPAPTATPTDGSSSVAANVSGNATYDVGISSRDPRDGLPDTYVVERVPVGTTNVSLGARSVPENASVLNETVDSCGRITSAGEYELTGDITNTSTATDRCIRIEASDVVFDGNGHAIEPGNRSDELGSPVTGIDIRGESTNPVTNVTVRNVGVRGWWGDEIAAHNASEVTIADVTVGKYDINLGDPGGEPGSLLRGDVTLAGVTAHSSILVNTRGDVSVVNVNSTTPGAVGLEVDSPTGNVSVANVTVRQTGATTSGAPGLDLDTGGGSLFVTDVSVANTSMDGIRAGSGADLTIENASVRGAGDDGVSLQSAGPVEARDVRIRDVATTGISIDSGDADLTARDIHVADAGTGAVFASDGLTAADGTEIIRNVRVENASTGILTRGTGSADLQNLTAVNTDRAFAMDTDGSVSVVGFSLGRASAPTVTVGFEATADPSGNGDVGLGVRYPDRTVAPPDGTRSVFRFVDVLAGTNSSFDRFGVVYDDANARNVEESTVRLWRYDGNWTALNGSVRQFVNIVGATEAVSDTDGYVTLAPLGSSTAPEPTYGGITVAPDPVETYADLTASVTIDNPGAAMLERVALTVEGRTVASRTVRLAGNENQTVSLDWTPYDPRVVSVSVVGTSANETVTVTEAPVPAPTAPNLRFFSVPIEGNATRTLAVTNDGGAPLTVGNATVTGANASAFAVTVENASRTLDTNEGIDLGVRFTPTSPGTKTATLRVETDAPGDAVTVPLSGTGATGRINVTTSAVEFGAVPAGDLATANVTVENDGFTSLSLTDASITGAGSEDFSVVSGAKDEVVPGETHVLTVGFRPGSGGPASATLELRSDDSDDPTATVPLDGRGTLPDAVPSTANLTYGGTPTNASTARTITVHNEGNATLVLSAPRVEGASPEAFAVVSSGGQSRLAPGERAAVTVAFTPPSATIHDATLVVPSNDPGGALNVSLSGPGEQSNVSVTPTSVAFGGVRVGATAQAEIDLRNAGGQQLNLTGVAIEGANASAFDLVSGAGEGTLAPGENRTLVARFAPGAPGGRTAVVSVASNDPVTPVVNVSLGGRGVQPDIAVSSAGLAYNETRVDGASERVVTVSNDGNANLTVTDATVVGAGAANFERSGSDAFTLVPGASRDLTVAFAPESPGDASATLRVESDDPDEGTATVGLTGRAVTPLVAVTPESLRFGAVAVNTTTSLTVTVSNGENATATLPVTGVSVIGPDADEFDAPGKAFTLAPGESRDLAVNITPKTPGDNKSATLRLLTADPGTPQVDVWLTNSETIVDVDPIEKAPDDTETAVSVNVTNARPNETVNANISQPDTREGDVGIDEVGAEPTRRANFSLNVSISDAPFGRNFTRTDVAEAVKYVRVEKTIPDSDLDDVSFQFRVSKVQLEAANATPTEMTLYRLDNGTWTELNVTVDRETRTHFIYQARAPGFSDFATGAKQPDFSVEEATLSVSAIRINQAVDILTRIANAEGAADGTFTVKLLLNGSVIESRVVTVPAGGLRQVVFNRTFEDAGTFTVKVNNRTAGRISVESADNGTGEPGDGGQTASFVVRNLEVANETVEVGEPVEVSATVRNNGTVTGTYESTFLVNGVVVDRRNVTLLANGSATVSFSRTLSSPGEFEVTIGDAAPVTITVEGSGAASPFTVREASLDADTVKAGTSVAVQATVANDRDEQVTATIELRIEGVQVQSKQVTLPANGSTTVTFNRTFEESGSFEVTVGNESAGTVQVEAVSTPTPTPTDPGPTETPTDTSDDTSSELGALVIGGALVALLALSAFLWWRRNGG